MRIDALYWDDNNIRHLWKRHVSPDDVEEIVFGTDGERARFLAKREGDAYKIYGETGGGRLLKMVGEFLPDGRFRIFHAMDMNDVERRKYRTGKL